MFSCPFDLPKRELTETTTLTETEAADSDILDPRCLTPLDRARRNRRKKLKPSPPGATQPPVSLRNTELSNSLFQGADVTCVG